jgi:hypothetical protein
MLQGGGRVCLAASVPTMPGRWRGKGWCVSSRCAPKDIPETQGFHYFFQLCYEGYKIYRYKIHNRDIISKQGYKFVKGNRPRPSALFEDRGGTRAVTFHDMVHVPTIGGGLGEIRRYNVTWFKTRPGQARASAVLCVEHGVDTARAFPAVFDL